MKKKTKRIMAWICIILLAGMYLINLVLALIDSEAARNMLLASCMCTILIPMVLYGLMAAFGATRKTIVEPDEKEASEKAVEE